MASPRSLCETFLGSCSSLLYDTENLVYMSASLCIIAQPTRPSQPHLVVYVCGGWAIQPAGLPRYFITPSRGRDVLINPDKSEAVLTANKPALFLKNDFECRFWSLAGLSNLCQTPPALPRKLVLSKNDECCNYRAVEVPPQAG